MSNHWNKCHICVLSSLQALHARQSICMHVPPHSTGFPEYSTSPSCVLVCVQVNLPACAAVRSDSAGSLLDAATLKAGVHSLKLQSMSTSPQYCSPPAAAGSKVSLSHACSATSLLLQQHHAAQHAAGSSTASAHTSGCSTDGAASLTGSSCSSVLKYSKDASYCGSSPCGGPPAAASISVTAVGGPGVANACSVLQVGPDRLMDRALGPFANAAAAAAVIGASGGSPAAVVGPQMCCQVQQPWPAGACAGAPAGPSPFCPFAFVPGKHTCSKQCLGVLHGLGSSK
jgi:hypothetical protein